MRRVEVNAGLILAASLMAIWVMAETAVAPVAAAQAEGFRTPLGAGWTAILAIVAVILFNGLFICCETAIDLLKPLHARLVREERDDRRGAILDDLVERKAKYVAACSVGSHVARLGLVFLGFMLAQGLALYIESDGGWTYSFGSVMLSALILAVPIVVANVILGELVPKSYATLYPVRVALRLHRFIHVVAAIFAVPAGLVVSLANVLAARFGGRATFSAENEAEEQIKSLVESAQETGAIEVDEKEMLHSVFEFTDTVAREVMTPRVDIDAVPLSSDPQKVVQLIHETGHSRIPIYEETDDQIVGIIHAKDLLLAMIEGEGEVSLRKLMRPAIPVPENKNLHDLLTEMRNARTQLVIVQDEFGGTSGIVTMEDIVEELVGDIVDEYDVEEPDVVETDEGFLADGRAHLDDVNDAVGSDLQSEEFDTIGGFVFGLFGRQPKLGETIRCEGLQFKVEETDGRRIEKLLIERAADEPEEQEEPA